MSQLSLLETDCRIGRLTSDVLLVLFGFLDAQSLTSVERVCKAWNFACKSTKLWKDMCAYEQRGSVPLIEFRMLQQGTHEGQHAADKRSRSDTNNNNATRSDNTNSTLLHLSSSSSSSSATLVPDTTKWGWKEYYAYYHKHKWFTCKDSNTPAALEEVRQALQYAQRKTLQNEMIDQALLMWMYT